MKKSEAWAYRKKIEAAAESQTDEQALESIELFPSWESCVKKKEVLPLGKRVSYDGDLWKVTQAHIPQADWNPRDAVSLFVRVTIEEWPEIPEVIPSTAPWMSGQKGTWKGQHYICNMDNCVWNPDVLPSAWDPA